MPRLKLVLAYDGTDFCGWQFQPEQRSVQGELEKAVTRITGSHIRVHGSGRTDSGVHARCQVVHLDIPDNRAGISWQVPLNSLLPDDVTVLDAEYVADDFHSRFSATAKRYTYTLWLENSFLLPWYRKFIWKCGPLDLDAIQLGMKYFTGTHDFAAFQNVGTEVSTTTRTIHYFKLCPAEVKQAVVLEVCGNGFLKQMVRNMVGCLVKIGRGKEEPEFVRYLLENKDRTLAPATAPAQGLCLDHVFYGEKGCDGPYSGWKQPCTDKSKGSV